MFDEEDEIKKPATAFQPLPLDGISIDELQDYIQDLETEIKRVKENIASKHTAMASAASAFKK